MIIFCNDKNEIKDVGTTLDSSLTPYTIDDADNPFVGWSVAKICCYKVNVVDNHVVMLTPYVDSRIIEHIERLGLDNEATEIKAVKNNAVITYLSMMVDVDIPE